MGVIMVIPAERCELCGSREVFRLPADWQDQVNAGKALPIAGCGNPWHYATASVGDVPAGRMCGRTDHLTGVDGRELVFRCDREDHHDGRHHATNVAGVEIFWGRSS